MSAPFVPTLVASLNVHMHRDVAANSFHDCEPPCGALISLGSHSVSRRALGRQCGSAASRRLPGPRGLRLGRDAEADRWSRASRADEGGRRNREDARRRNGASRLAVPNCRRRWSGRCPPPKAVLRGSRGSTGGVRGRHVRQADKPRAASGADRSQRIKRSSCRRSRGRGSADDDRRATTATEARDARRFEPADGVRPLGAASLRALQVGMCNSQSAQAPQQLDRQHRRNPLRH